MIKIIFISRRLAAHALLLCAAFAVLAQAQTQPQYEVEATKNVTIPMRDGVKLVADIYRPAQNGKAVEGKFPTLLVRTPYTRAFEEGGNAANFVPHGYVFIAESIRGRYGQKGIGASSVMILRMVTTRSPGLRRSPGVTAM